MPARRLLLATVLPAALLVGPLADSAFAGEDAPVLANVTAPAPGAVQDGPGTVTFAAAAEKTTPITKVEVTLPTGTSLSDVTVPAMDGWTSASTTVPLPSCGAEAVTGVTWTATGDGIAPQDIDRFAIQVGHVSDADQVAFSGLVTYADGTVASWTEQATVSAPQLPAFLDLAPSAPASSGAEPTAQGSWMGTFVRPLTSPW